MNFFLPIRWQIIIILCFSTLIIFILRINMSVIILQISYDLNWSQNDLQNVLSSLYYGYAIGQLPFNFISHKYGGSIALGISIIISCILNLFIPIASKTSILSIIILQIFIGFFQAGAFPSCYYLYPRWMPISERTVMVAFVVTGVYMGEIIGLGLSGYLVNMPDIYINNFQIGSWDSSFYITSLFGVVWFPLFYYFVYDSPAEHPRITDEEYEFIHKGSGFREDSEDNQKIVKNINDNTSEVFTKLEDGELNGDISLIETHLNPLKSNQELQEDHIENSSQKYNVIKQGIDNEHNDENENENQNENENTSLKESELKQQMKILTDEKNDTVNPLYLSITDEEKNEEKHKGSHIAPWLHDLRLHPDWHPGLPPGRLHHHYHLHHSHKLELNKVPWLKIFTNTASLALLINTFAQGWVSLMILSEMPAFLHQQLGCDISHSSYLSILPYIFNLVAVELFSIIFNTLMVKGILSRWQVRQWANRIGLLGPSICVVIVGHVTDPGVGVTILCIALFLFGAVQSGTPCGFMDIAPNFSSEMNTVAIVFLSCAGFLTPMLVSYYQRLYSVSLAWQYVFYITFLICGVSIIIWRIFGRSEIITELNTRI